MYIYFYIHKGSHQTCYLKFKKTDGSILCHTFNDYIVSLQLTLFHIYSCHFSTGVWVRAHSWFKFQHLIVTYIIQVIQYVFPQLTAKPISSLFTWYTFLDREAEPPRRHTHKCYLHFLTPVSTMPLFKPLACLVTNKLCTSWV